MPKIKTTLIPLAPASDLPDISCRDGEIACFRNMEWPAEESATSGNSPNNSSGGNFCLSRADSDISFPPGSHLFLIHDVADPEIQEGDRTFYFFTTPNGRLGCRRKRDRTVSYISGYSSETSGTVNEARPFRNTIYLLTSRGLHFLLYHPDSDSWSYAESLPEKPQLTVSETPAHLPGWTSTAGNLPRTSMSISLNSPENISESMIDDWITGRNPAAISDLNARRISSAVLEALKRLIADAETAGCFMLPAQLCAAYGQSPIKNISAIDRSSGFFALPSEIDNVRHDITKISAFIQDFGWWNGNLSLTVRFSLPPLKLTATVTPGNSLKKWNDIFTSLNIFVRKSGHLIYGKSSETAVSPVEGEFIFPISSEDNANISSGTSFYRAASISTKNLEKWTTVLPATFLSSTSYWPDLADFNSFAPKGCFITPKGGGIFGGTGKISNGKGGYTLESFDTAIISSVDPEGVIFRNICNLNSIFITAISGKRMKLFSPRGIWNLNESAEGTVSLGKFIAYAPVVENTVCESEGGIFFMTSGGIQFLSDSSKISRLITMDSLMEKDIGSSCRLAADHASGALIIVGEREQEEGYILNALNPASGKLSEMTAISVSRPVDHEGRLHLIDSDGEGYSLIITEERSGVSPGNRDGISNASRADESDGYLMTRPIKLGNPFVRNRIMAITFDTQLKECIIEGSDNLRDWHCIIAGRGPFRALHSPAFCHHRISIVFNKDFPPRYLHLQYL